MRYSFNYKAKEVEQSESWDAGYRDKILSIERAAMKSWSEKSIK